MKTCEACGKKTEKLFHQMFQDGDYLEICQECLDQYEIQADAEYERQREEGICA